jgi:phage recombination protein Bet
MNNEIAKTENKDIAEMQINPWIKLEVVKKCFAPTLTDDEFKIFVGLGKSLKANPFTREIWAVKYDKNAASIFCGRDFYRRKAQEQKDYNGHIVNAIYENDGFSIKNGQPEHIVNSFKDRGALIGAFCAVYKKGLQVPFFVTVQLNEYNKGFSNWKNMPETMIKKVAEAQALRGAYQGIFAGTYEESEEETIKINALNSGDLANAQQIDYAFNLLRNTAYSDDAKFEIESELTYGITTERINQIINNLRINQISIIDIGNPSQKEINAELDRKINKD